MSERRLPVRPDLKQLRNQAKDLLRAIRAKDGAALAELRQFHPHPPEPERATLSDAQLALARSYQAPSWPRIVQCCNLIDAIWDDDVETVRRLVLENPNLLTENAGIRNNNWGPPMSCAANLGRDRIIGMLHGLGAKDLRTAFGRAVLQGRIETARKLHKMLGSPRPPRGALGVPAYTLSVSGTALLFELGVEMLDEQGQADAPVDVVLDSDSRKPEAMHQILEMYASHGFEFPDTPTMALHRGRVDLLEQHLRKDPSLLRRTFAYQEIFPPELKCGREELRRTTLAGATLLHICVEYDELNIARWLLDQGMDPDVGAAVDADGFGGHTALFGAVVSYPNFWMNYTGGWAHSRKPLAAPFAELLLDRGADPNARASLRQRVPTEQGEVVREYRDVTPLGWGKAFPVRIVVSEPAMKVIEERGGHL
jgi:hypothetical protein